MKQQRNNTSGTHIEGKRAVIEALRAQVPLEKLMLADNLKRDGQVQDILRKAKHAGIEPVYLPKKKMDEMSHIEAHQGVIALAKPYMYAGISDIIAHANKRAQETGSALVVVTDHITDAGNLGAIIRSAEAFGASGVCIPNVRSAEITASTYKSSAGALNHIHVARIANISQVLDRLKKEGFWVAGASEKAAVSAWDAPLHGKMVLVLGNEAEGISRLVLESCDFTFTLPQTGKTSSLNVAQAATACIYEWVRQSSAKHVLQG